MSRAILLLAFLALTGKAFSQDLPAWFAQSLLVLPEEIAEAAKGGKRVMLYFEQDGCPYCKRMVEVNFREPKIASRLQERFVPIALNIWGDREVTWTDGVARREGKGMDLRHEDGKTDRRMDVERHADDVGTRMRGRVEDHDLLFDRPRRHPFRPLPCQAFEHPIDGLLRQTLGGIEP